MLGLVIGLLADSGSSPNGSSSPGPLPALTPSAPPSDTAAVAPCTALLQTLPISLDGLASRAVHPVPDSRFVVAWGDPAIILRCGVGRPADLHPGSSASLTGFGLSDGSGQVYFDVTSSKGEDVYTSVDRAVYVGITVPAQYPGGTYVTTLAAAIAAAMPAVCVGGQPGAGPLPPASTLCANRP